ncbi:beta-1,6-N-acetylglucosaminyltransferase [Rhizobium sp. B21/90]|uniref:beta-1,6-N-acetylglucosaminyltransferase n=1 Tax=Rhizobium sp. B21/90 TaxID=2819993 RepID=UPI001C5B9F3F|nr:beta-1,6-N-acetylglucosaminyltransferase [Rhizobium sp. B21/90]QYA03912.1 hypothetical protein J5278_24350 [Rhizobium sp. B21/90]
MLNWAILITAHDDPEHLRRFIDVMADDHVWFYIHVDLKSDVDRFTNLQTIPRVCLIESRVNVNWGGWSQVQATLNLIEAARKSPHEFKYYTFASGNHFPIQKPEKIWSHYIASGSEYINLVSVPNIALQKNMSRFKTFNVDGAYRPQSFAARLKSPIYRLIARLPIRNIEKYLNGWTLYAGSNWWTLSNDAISCVVETIKTKPELVEFFRYVKCPDESFFQTILGNSGFLASCARADVYTDWSDPKEAPAQIRMSHLPLILADDFTLADGYGAGPAHFARKFSTRNIDVVRSLQDVL